MKINGKFLKAAVAKCAAGVEAGTGLAQAGKVIFVPGFIMGIGTSVNVRVPCPEADFAFMVDKGSLDKVLSKATGNIDISRDGERVVLKYGRSRLALPFADLPQTLAEFPEEWGPVPGNFIGKLKAVTFPNKTGYAGVAWDCGAYAGLISTDSIRIVTADCPNLPKGAWLPDAAVSALSKAGTEATGIVNDMPYIHVQYADGTVCSVLYRAIGDFPIPALCQYIDSFDGGEVVAEGELGADALEAIKSAETFTDVFDAQMPVHISFEPGKLAVRAENSGGEFYGEAEWTGEYTGHFTVDARPFNAMGAGAKAILKSIDGNISLEICGDGVRVLLSPDP